jgi:hypothetical protein
MELLWRGLWGSQRATRPFSSSHRMRMTTGQFRRLRLDSPAPFQRQKPSARCALSHGSGGVLHAPEDVAKINAGWRLRMRRRCHACARLARRVVSYLGGSVSCACRVSSWIITFPDTKVWRSPPQTRQIAYTTAIVLCARRTARRRCNWRQPTCEIDGFGHCDAAIRDSRKPSSDAI